jgi:hypothetical protein
VANLIILFQKMMRKSLKITKKIVFVCVCVFFCKNSEKKFSKLQNFVTQKQKNHASDNEMMENI